MKSVISSGRLADSEQAQSGKGGGALAATPGGDESATVELFEHSGITGSTALDGVLSSAGRANCTIAITSQALNTTSVRQVGLCNSCVSASSFLATSSCSSLFLKHLGNAAGSRT